MAGGVAGDLFAQLQRFADPFGKAHDAPTPDAGARAQRAREAEAFQGALEGRSPTYRRGARPAPLSAAQTENVSRATIAARAVEADLRAGNGPRSAALALTEMAAHPTSDPFATRQVLASGVVADEQRRDLQYGLPSLQQREVIGVRRGRTVSEPTGDIISPTSTLPGDRTGDVVYRTRDRSWREVATDAAQITGVPPTFLTTLVGHESGGRTDATPGTSSASGLGQFVDQTWLHMVYRYGAQHGQSELASLVTRVRNSKGETSYQVADPAMRRQILALRNDPRIATVMAGHYAKEVATDMRPLLGRNVTEAEVYLGYFAGPQHAADLITEVSDHPNEANQRTGEQVVGHKASWSNGRIFFEGGRYKNVPNANGVGTHEEYQGGGRPRSAQEVIAIQRRHFSDTAWPGDAPEDAAMAPERTSARAYRPVRESPQTTIIFGPRATPRHGVRR